MQEKNKTAIVVAIIGLIGSIGGTTIGVIYGNDYGENHQEEYFQSQIARVNGDNNTVTINSVSDLINVYNMILDENKILKDQNISYYNDLTSTNSKLDALTSQVDDIPSLNYRDLALSIDGDDIIINQNNSMVTIDGRDYVSKEIMENLVSDNQSITIKNNTIYIGKVIADKENLFKQNIMDQSSFCMIDTIVDSYGNIYSNSLYCPTGCTGNKYIIYVLNNKYSLLQLTFAIRDNADLNQNGIITIKADDNVVYTSKNLDKKTKPFTESDIPINNCMLLTIEYDCGLDFNDCIIPNAMMYN